MMGAGQLFRAASEGHRPCPSHPSPPGSRFPERRPALSLVAPVFHVPAPARVTLGPSKSLW